VGATSSASPEEVRATTRRWAAVGAAFAAAAVMLGPAAAAGTVQNASPYWFRDDYLDTNSVNLAATTAVVDVASPGTVTLPYAPLQAAFDPNGTYALVATEGGVDAYVFDGQSVVAVTNWGLGSLPATGVAWVEGGDAFAVSTASQVVVYGLNGQGDAVLAAQTAAAGVIGLAPGPAALPSAVLAATANGADVYEAQGTSLVPISVGAWRGTWAWRPRRAAPWPPPGSRKPSNSGPGTVRPTFPPRPGTPRPLPWPTARWWEWPSSPRAAGTGS